MPYQSLAEIKLTFLSHVYSLATTETIENLDCCLELKYLDISSNDISKIDNLSTLQSLESLIMKQNRLSKPDSIRNVIYMKKLRELDLSTNKINCLPEVILEILSQCKSLRVLSLKGNPIAKTKHYRKLIISRCKKLTHLDGNSICKEERRRCTAWGKVVTDGGSFDEADGADRQELNRIKTEESEANALRRSRHGSDDGSTSSKNISSSVIEGIKKAFGLTDSSRQPSSNISWSSRMNLDASHGSDQVSGSLHDKRKSMKKELEQVKGIVESQRVEIHQLKEQLDQIESNEGAKQRSIEDSERDTSYSFIENEQLAKKAANATPILSDLQDVDFFAAPNNGTQQQHINRSSSMVSNPFAIFPPAPPPRNVSM